MQRDICVAALSLFLLNGCALFGSSASNEPEIGHPTDQQALDCRIEGLVFQDLARLRDAGTSARDAANRVDTQYRALPNSLDERDAVDLALARRDGSAQFIYAHGTLKPETLRYVGSSACLIRVAGDQGADRPNALAGSAEDCQNQYLPGSAAEPQLKSCIVKAAAQLLGQ